jgi:hypothetical protein
METKELELRITENEGDTIALYLDPNKMPEIYRRKKHELVHCSGMSEPEADKYLLNTPITLELFYDVDRGLFAVEAEACESNEIYNPYTGKTIPNDNLPPVAPPSPLKIIDNSLCQLEDINSELRSAWEDGDFNSADEQRLEDARDSIDDALNQLHSIGDPEDE